MKFPNFAETQQNSRNACVSALKSCPDYPILLILGPLAPKTPEFEEIPQIWWNSWKFSEICGILRNPTLFAEKRDSGENDQNTYKIPLELQYFSASAQNGVRFRAKCNFPGIL